jgi:hypothetical protein
MSSKRALSSSVTLTFIFIIVFSILFILIYLPGCADEEVNTTSTSTVSGKVSGREGVPLSGVMVSINSGNAVTTSSYGTFSISGVEPPYDLNIFHQPEPFFYQFRGLNTLSPDVELNVSALEPLDYWTIINVSFPKVLPGRSLMFSYITGLHTKVIIEDFTDSTAHLKIKWLGQAYINGGLAMMQVTKDPGNRITSFDKYGTKMIWVQNGLSYSVNYSSSELQLDPQELTSQITAPPGVVFGGMNIKLLFKEFPFSSGFSLAEEEFPLSANFKVPAELPNPFKISYELDPIDTISGFEMSAMGFMDPGESYNITMPESFHLLYPSADTTGVNFSTVFSHDNTGKIYEFTVGPYNIITSESSIILPRTENYGIYLPSNTMMIWNVKLLNFTGIDDLVRTRDLNYSTSHKIIIGTPSRVITTGVIN